MRWLSVNAPMVVAVADRAGNILAVYDTAGAPATAIGNFGQTVPSDDLAVGLARTAAFFSNDQAPLSSRTVRFISGIHFPPGVAGTPNADLYGIENTNRGCTLSTNFLPGQTLNPSRSIDSGSFGPGIITGKADTNDDQPFAVNPGGVPLFNGGAVGGVGVVSTSPQIAEYAAFSAAIEFGPSAHYFSASATGSRSHRRNCACLSWTRPRSRRARLPAHSLDAGSYEHSPDSRHAAPAGLLGRAQCWHRAVAE